MGIYGRMGGSGGYAKWEWEVFYTLPFGKYEDRKIIAAGIANSASKSAKDMGAAIEKYESEQKTSKK